MKIETLEFAGVRSALHAMRNPMDSWAKGDTTYHLTTEDYPEEPFPTTIDFLMGENDKDLSSRLQKAGPEHAKHLRMVMVWADITAPRYWWNEFDTYRAGVEKVSCSTMHRMMARELLPGDFEGCNDHCYSGQLLETMDYINTMIAAYKASTDPEEKRIIWEYVIQILPQSYRQKRTVMMSYAALRNIYRQREGHKLNEWHQFRAWVESLPESWMITE